MISISHCCELLASNFSFQFTKNRVEYGIKSQDLLGFLLDFDKLLKGFHETEPEVCSTMFILELLLLTPMLLHVIFTKNMSLHLLQSNVERCMEEV